MAVFTALSALETQVSDQMSFVIENWFLDGRDNFEKSCVICGKKKDKTFDLQDRN